MPSPTNTTNITPPRVPVIDPRTGLISREWYRFLLNLYTITGAGTGVTPIANGGTNSTSTPQSGAIAYGDGTSYRFTTVGSPGQVLTSNGAGSPGWATPTTGTVTSVDVSGGTTGFTTSGGPITSSGTITLGGTLATANGGTNSTATPTAGAVPYGTGTAYDFTAVGTAGQVLTSAGAGTPTWATPTTGTVTSVGQTFTGGLISVAGSPVTSSGTLALTVAGTSGGVPYFSSASTWASSAALAANALVIGGGAGVAPATTTTGTGVVTALGTNVGAAGAFVVNGGALGTPSSGTVTNLTGTASININGTVGATTPTTGVFTRVTSRTNSGGAVSDVMLLQNNTPTTINTGVAVYFDPNGSGTGRAASVQSVQSTSGNYADFRFFTANATTPAERMRISAAGNVGVSQTSPTSNLDVNGSIAFRAPSLVNAATYATATTDVSLRFTTTACTVTLPSAASFSGRILYLNNVTAIAVTSSANNVIPLGSNTAGTAILAATAGKFAMIQSDGTNWITMMAN